MQPITITAVVDEKRRIMIDLPDDIPTGAVRITVQPIGEPAEQYAPGSREWAQAKLIEAGLVNPNARYAPPDAVSLSDEERDRIGKQLAGGKTSLELINEEREERL
jgi:hypothetical protein